MFNIYSLIHLQSYRMHILFYRAILKWQVEGGGGWILHINHTPLNEVRPPQTGLRGYTYRLLLELSRLGRRSCPFSVCVLKYWNKLPEPLVLLPPVSMFKNKLDRQWSKILPDAPVYFLSPFMDIFLDIVTPDYLYFSFPQTLFIKCGFCCPYWPILPLINK